MLHFCLKFPKGRGIIYVETGVWKKELGVNAISDWQGETNIFYAYKL